MVFWGINRNERVLRRTRLVALLREEELDDSCCAVDGVLDNVAQSTKHAFGSVQKTGEKKKIK